MCAHQRGREGGRYNAERGDIGMRAFASQPGMRTAVRIFAAPHTLS
jgi:hypothetical protein